MRSTRAILIALVTYVHGKSGEDAMLEIGVLIYGIYALVTGKFALFGGRKLSGWRGRVTGAILLSYLGLAFVGGAVLVLIGYESVLSSRVGMLVYSVVLLAFTIIISCVVGNFLYHGQEAQNASIQERSGNFEGDNEDESPYRSPRV